MISNGEWSGNLDFLRNKGEGKTEKMSGLPFLFRVQGTGFFRPAVKGIYYMLKNYLY